MADHYLDLETDVRREALEFAASESGRPAYLLEKDIWVVWTLRTLFGAPVGASLVFKGGTSLSKAYGVIRRFSEDVDLTYDIRDIAPDLIGDSANPLPRSPRIAAKKSGSTGVRRNTPAPGRVDPKCSAAHVLAAQPDTHRKVRPRRSRRPAAETLG